MIAIIGAGPAGLSCALWLKRLGYRPFIVEQSPQPGGQGLALDRVNQWCLGQPDQTSRELAQNCAEHIRQEAIETLTRHQLTRVQRGEHSLLSLQITDSCGVSHNRTVTALVIATGIRPRNLQDWAQIKGVIELEKTGLMSFFPTDHLAHITELRNQRIAIIGAGDNALFTALDVAAMARETHLIQRSAPRAQNRARRLLAEATAKHCIIEHRPYTLASCQRRNQMAILRLSHTETAAVQTLAVDRVFVRSGFVTNSAWLHNCGLLADVKTDARGYIHVDADTRSSVVGVYAIGDITHPDHQALVIAIADGAIAARSIDRDLNQETDHA